MMVNVPRGGVSFDLRAAPLDGGPPETLLSFRLEAAHIPEEGVPSKALYRVAPGGRHLAIRDWKRRALHLRDARGPLLTLERVQRFHFSPDGRWLAVAQGLRNGPAEILAYDLAAAAPRAKKLGEVRHLEEINWLPGGVVAHEEIFEGERDRNGQRSWEIESRHALVYFPLDGAPRTLTTSPRGSRASPGRARPARPVFASLPGAPWEGAAAWITDGDGAPRRLGRARFSVTNAELSPDGKQALFSTWEHVFHVDVDDGGVPQPVAEVRKAHSLWFSDDGAQYLWASLERAVLHRGGRDLPFPPLATRGTKAESIRFLADGAALVLMDARAKETVYRWDPDKGDPTVLYSAREHDSDVDLFNGRLLRLTARSDIHFVPIDHSTATATANRSDDGVLPLAD